MFKTKNVKFIAVILSLAILASIFPLAAQADTIPALTKSAVFTIGSQTVVVDGTSYQMDVAPYIDSANRTQVPVRYLGDVLGMDSQWDAAKQTVYLTGRTRNDNEDLTIGSNKLNWTSIVNGSTTMDTTPVIVPPGRTMLPARWVAQAIGYNVTWNAANQTVTVSPQSQAGGGGSGVSGPVSQGTGTGVSAGTTPIPGAHNF